MAVKTFTTGEVLTSSDTNTYLANAGLVYITTKTASASSAVNLDGCFTSTYDNYRIVISNATADATRAIYFRLRASGTDSSASYYYGGQYTLFAGTGGTNNGNNVGQIVVGTFGASVKGGSTFDVCNPADAVHTTVIGSASNVDAWAAFSGVHQVNTAYDGFSLVPAAGNTTLTVRVYGYREA